MLFYGVLHTFSIIISIFATQIAILCKYGQVKYIVKAWQYTQSTPT